MRIAVFHNLQYGGAKRVLHGFVRYLSQSGHSVDVHVPSTANETILPLRDVASSTDVYPVRSTVSGRIRLRLPYIPNAGISLNALEKTEKAIADRINGGGYDVVLCEQDQYTMSPYLLKHVRTPTVYFCQQPSRRGEEILIELSKRLGVGNRTNPIKGTLRNSFFRRMREIDRVNASFSKSILANSFFSRESILRSYGLNSRVCYLGVDTEFFKPLGIPREDFVLSVGSCAPPKGFDFLIESLGYMCREERPKLVIASNDANPEWKGYLERLASKRGVDLQILSMIDDAHLRALYNKAKAVLYAPYLEPFGLVPIEAMACGTPVVAVREGGVRESVVHNETGLLSERDERAFSEAVSGLLKDTERRETMGKNAIDVVRDFWTMDHAGLRLLGHLNRAKKSD
ncbi:MAG TPA: glycosyltransferase family 4 protein [Thermoplasmata archaeon]|nr:glycosyltransferase family 4 protein [Thermoplasmata archaeon]